MTILCGRTRKGRFDGPVVKAIFAAHPRAYAAAYISVLLFLYRPFRSLIPVRKYSAESLVYTGQHVHPKTLYNVLLDPVPPFPQPSPSHKRVRTHIRVHDDRRPVLPAPEKHRSMRRDRGPVIPVYCPFEGAPRTNSYRGECHLRGREAGEVRRVKEPEILGPLRRWTKGIGKQSNGFKSGVRPDFNGRFTKSYRFHCVSAHIVHTHVRGIRKRPTLWNLIRFRLKNHYSPGICRRPHRDQGEGLK